MSEARHIRNVALVGFMGTGKTTVGRILAAQLRFELIDTDHLIEERARATIPEIFARSGEATFRTLEQQVVAELADRSDVVISTGGGLVVNPDNLASLKRHALVVCLWASPETIWERVRHSSHRPLLQDADPQERIRRLLADREPAYRQADVLVASDARSAREVATHVLHHFQSLREPGQPG